MQVRELTIMVGTDQIEAMTRFYGATLGLERVAKFRDPVFEAAGGFIRLLDHSEISGPTLEPARMQINLFVDDVSSEFRRVISADPTIGVHREPARESWGGEVATLLDPDGNFVQLLELTGD
jgi:catechol 2,3-dioxygenase-like lactoylglutathione lyase family enzyme